ncbi:hypothetical protein C8J56DRAFT_244234 [Mycena floridula]|nr:hypothetical protein C8J56DRAFT_244234 [Mycena floridula]
MFRVAILLKRRSDLSFEEFEKLWENHAKLYANLKYVQENFIRYLQFHPKADLAAQLENRGLGEINAIDGIQAFDATSIDAFLGLLEDEEYKRVIIPDEARFLDREATRINVGDVAVKFQQK